jgi:hypothetical protein
MHLKLEQALVKLCGQNCGEVWSVASAGNKDPNMSLVWVSPHNLLSDLVPCIKVSFCFDH